MGKKIAPFRFKHLNVVDLMGDLVLKINQIVAWINRHDDGDIGGPKNA